MPTDRDVELKTMRMLALEQLGRMVRSRDQKTVNIAIGFILQLPVAASSTPPSEPGQQIEITKKLSLEAKRGLQKFLDETREELRPIT